MQIVERGLAGHPLPSTTGQYTPPSALLSKPEHYTPIQHTGGFLIADCTCCCKREQGAVQQVLLGQRHFLHFPESQCWHLFPSHLQRRPFHTCHYVLGTRHLQNHPKEFKFKWVLLKCAPMLDIRNILDGLRYLNHKLYNNTYKL